MIESIFTFLLGTLSALLLLTMIAALVAALYCFYRAIKGGRMK